MAWAALVTTLLASCIATVAAAQGTVTTCGPEAGKWVCRTKQPQPDIWSNHQFTDVNERMQRSYEQTVRMQEDRARMEALNAPPAIADSGPPPKSTGVLSQALREGRIIVRQQEVAAFLREGNCEAAKMRALADDDIDLADKAARICTPK